MKNTLPDKVDFLPVYRYKGSRSNIFTGMYSVLVESIRNSYGKKRTIYLNKNHGSSHLDGRGDTHHRNGGIMSLAQHESYVATAEANREAFLKNRQK